MHERMLCLRAMDEQNLRRREQWKRDQGRRKTSFAGRRKRNNGGGAKGGGQKHDEGKAGKGDARRAAMVEMPRK